MQYDLIIRANTIKLSRPEIWRDMVAYEEETDRTIFADWYILGDVPPNYPVPAIPLATLIGPDRVIIAEVDFDDDYDNGIEFYPAVCWFK